MRRKPPKACAPPQPQYENVEIRATPNGFVTLGGAPVGDARYYAPVILGSFESRRSLLAWLGERLVQR